MHMVLNAEKALISVFLSPPMILEHLTGVSTIAPHHPAFYTSDCSLEQSYRKPVSSQKLIPMLFHSNLRRREGKTFPASHSYLFPFPFYTYERFFFHTQRLYKPASPVTTQVSRKSKLRNIVNCVVNLHAAVHGLLPQTATSSRTVLGKIVK